MKRIWILCAVCLLLCGTACGKTEPEDSSAPQTTTTTATTTTTVADGLSFTATVTQVGEDWLLVEADGGSTVAGTVRVLLEQTPTVAAGDRVRITHTGQMMPSLPPQLVATNVEKIG